MARATGLLAVGPPLSPQEQSSKRTPPNLDVVDNLNIFLSPMPEQKAYDHFKDYS